MVEMLIEINWCHVTINKNGKLYTFLYFILNNSVNISTHDYMKYVIFVVEIIICKKNINLKNIKTFLNSVLRIKCFESLECLGSCNIVVV